MSHTFRLLISTACALALSGCGNPQVTSESDSDLTSLSADLLSELAPADWADAAAAFTGRDGAQNGYVVLTNAPGAGVLMRIDLKGLTEGWHGIHLHNVGDCSDIAEGFKASGGHVDPNDREHGLLNPNGFERADMPNIYAGPDGRATAEIYNDSVALFASEAAAAEAGPHPLIDEDGFAIVVHEAADDHKTQPIGGAGARVACAAISGE
ncbi:MAG: superoxide dismutase family protein [Marinicaulis sp.]|nr:superoxide dismutase family protein [Marinicaulis sp.]NNE40115.1 superoxide dismutase family protein [Marinicaulis sp.]NNL90246.1 superoxide dismutase family protein [Marinicaulis sp.]